MVTQHALALVQILTRPFIRLVYHFCCLQSDMLFSNCADDARHLPLSQGIISRAEQAFNLVSEGYKLYLIISSKPATKELGESDLTAGVPFLVANFDSFKAYRNVMVKLKPDNKNRKVVNLCITPREYRFASEDPVPPVIQTTETASLSPLTTAAGSPTSVVAASTSTFSAGGKCKERSPSLGTALCSDEVDAIRNAYIGGLSALHPGLPEFITARAVAIEAEEQLRKDSLANLGDAAEQPLSANTPPPALAVLPAMPGAMPLRELATLTENTSLQSPVAQVASPSAKVEASTPELDSPLAVSSQEDTKTWVCRRLSPAQIARRNRWPYSCDEHSTSAFSFEKPPPPTKASVKIFGNGSGSEACSRPDQDVTEFKNVGLKSDSFHGWGKRRTVNNSQEPVSWRRKNAAAAMVTAAVGNNSCSGSVPVSSALPVSGACPTTNTKEKAGMLNTSYSAQPAYGQANKYDSLKVHVDKFVSDFNNTLADMFGVPFPDVVEKVEKEVLTGEGEKEAFVPIPVTKENHESDKPKHKATCDMCSCWIIGVRHKCLDCPDW